jgi:hypothetical protein
MKTPSGEWIDDFPGGFKQLKHEISEAKKTKVDLILLGLCR